MKRSIVLAFLVLAGAGTQATAEIVPHEARYRIDLDQLRVQGFAVEAEGAMAIRAARDCEKWEIVKELIFVVSLSDGQALQLHTLERYYEGLDGERLEFTGWFKVNGSLRLNVKGRATLTPGRGGAVRFVRPENEEMALPAGTRFPMMALEQTLDALRAGRSLPEGTVYSGMGLTVTTRAAPAEARPFKHEPKGDVALLRGRSWRVQGTMFPDPDRRGDPLATESTEILANGVISRFSSDFDAMTVSGELVEIKKLPLPGC